jgi:hypothetical protein
MPLTGGQRREGSTMTGLENGLWKIEINMQKTGNHPESIRDSILH